MNIEKVIEEAYKLYMPQVKSEITDFANFLYKHRELALFANSGIKYSVLEIGTKYGGTFYIWNELNKDSGVNISIDMSDGGIHGGVTNEIMNERDVWFYERYPNCHFIRGDSHSDYIWQQAFEMLYLNSPIDQYQSEIELLDFLFIDGDHTYEGVKQDFEMYSGLVREGGLIAFHDINDTERHRERNVYVGKFWKELTKKTDEFHFIEFNAHEDWAGIGIAIKRKKWKTEQPQENAGE